MTKIRYTLIIAASLVTLLPASQGLADPSVTVVNPATNPAKTSNVDDPGRIPYRFNATHPTCPSQGSCFVVTPPIPQGKRLVVQHVSAWGELSSPGTFVEVVVRGSSSSALSYISTFDAPALGVAAGGPGFAFDQTVLGTADAGDFIQFFVSSNGTVTPNVMIITGYLLDCAVNQCAPLAAFLP